MGALLGLSAKCYRGGTSRSTWAAVGADGYSHQGAAPVGLTNIANIKDLSLSIDTAEADVTTRGNNGWNASIATLKSAELSFQMVYDNTDADVTAIEKSFFLNQNLAMAVLDGDKGTAGVQGLWADFMVTKFEKTENLQDAQMVSVSLKPGYSTVAPEWVKVS